MKLYKSDTKAVLKLTHQIDKEVDSKLTFNFNYHYQFQSVNLLNLSF